MDFVNFIIGLLKDPRGAIAGWIITLGAVWVYAPLFLIIFMETGLVVTPFLPGDSLLFAAGVFCADGGGLNIWASLIIFSAAAILGNTSNYWIGRGFGHAIIDSGKVKALTPDKIERTHKFFDKWGALAVVVTRFFPIIRTISPFIAGIDGMSFPKFTLFNCIGGISWVSLFTLMGFFFGGIPFVEQHFEWVLVFIIVISLVPAVVGAVKAKQAANKSKASNAAEGDE